MADLRQILSQGRKRIGILIGAGAPTAIRVDEHNRIVADGKPLIPDVAGLTDAVLATLAEEDQRCVGVLKNEIPGNVNIEAILTQVRRLAQAIGTSVVHGLDGGGYDDLGQRICAEIGTQVCSGLPEESNPYSQLVSWIAGTQREHSVEIFTPNYDLLIEEAFERATSCVFRWVYGIALSLSSIRPVFPWTNSRPVGPVSGSCTVPLAGRSWGTLLSEPASEKPRN